MLYNACMCVLHCLTCSLVCSCCWFCCLLCAQMAVAAMQTAAAAAAAAGAVLGMCQALVNSHPNKEAAQPLLERLAHSMQHTVTMGRQRPTSLTHKNSQHSSPGSTPTTTCSSSSCLPRSSSRWPANSVGATPWFAVTTLVACR